MSGPATDSPADEVYVLQADGRTIATDQLGYLLDPAEWNPIVGDALAAHEEIELGPDHWQMIQFVRDWFEERQLVPEARWLLKAMREQLGEEKGTRRYLHRVFATRLRPRIVQDRWHDHAAQGDVGRLICMSTEKAPKNRESTHVIWTRQEEPDQDR